MDGVLVIDKPAGPTSFDVVKRVRVALREKKVGHTGTLDPMATGVLAVCLGEATKLSGFITEGDKAYQATIRLGEETDTQDAQGKVTAQAPVPELSRELLEHALAAFRGTFQQTPPMYSAVKVAGKRLYELARAGEQVERAPRTVTVHALVLEDFEASALRVSVQCSKGFFVRTLAFDLGRSLGCGAHLATLRRTSSGPFTLAQALPLAELEALCAAPEGREQVERRRVSLADALSQMPAVRVSVDEARRAGHGVPLEVTAEGRVRVLDPDGRLVAVADAANGRLKYMRVMGAT